MQNPNFGKNCKIPNPKLKIRNPELQIQNSKSEIQNPKILSPDFGFRCANWKLAPNWTFPKCLTTRQFGRICFFWKSVRMFFFWQDVFIRRCDKASLPEHIEVHGMWQGRSFSYLRATARPRRAGDANA